MAAHPEAPVRQADAPVGAGPERTRADWLVPAVVALAVGVILLVTAFAGHPGSGGHPGPPQESLRPGPGRVAAPTDVCPGPVRALVPGAALAAQSPDPVNGATFWAGETRFVLCATDAGAVTVRRTGRMGARLTADALRPTTIVLTRSAYLATRRYVAGGPLPDGVTQIAYLFPGAGRQVAHVLIDQAGHRWWLLDFLPTSGVLTDPHLELADLAPVHAVVTRSDGSTRSYTLPWSG